MTLSIHFLFGIISSCPERMLDRLIAELVKALPQQLRALILLIGQQWLVYRVARFDSVIESGVCRLNTLSIRLASSTARRRFQAMRK